MCTILTLPHAPHLSFRSGFSLFGFLLRGVVGVWGLESSFWVVILLCTDELNVPDSLLSPSKLLWLNEEWGVTGKNYSIQKLKKNMSISKIFTKV